MTAARPARPTTPGHSRRTFLSGAVGGALALGLAGCGGGEPQRAGGGSGGGRFPVRVRHKYGTTEITSADRVAVVGYTDADTVLALGATPVLLSTLVEELRDVGVGPWVEKRLPDPRPVVAVGDDLDLERLAGQRPDVILSVTNEIDRPMYNRLSKLAPTVAPPPGYPSYGVPWDVATVLQASALGRRAEGERLARRTRSVLADVRRTVGAPEGATAAVVSAAAGVFYVFAETDLRGNLLRDIGLRQAPAVADAVGDAFFAELSEERLDILEDVDVLVNVTYDPAEARTFANSRPWQRLPAVREGRLAATRGLVEGLAWQVSTVESIPYVMPRVAPRLRDAFARVRG